MKIKPIIFLLITLFFVKLSFGQGTSDEESYESARVGIYTKVLDLTPDEAKKFWPVFNQFSFEMKKIKDEQRNYQKDAMARYSSLTDAEIEKLINQSYILDEKQIALKKRYTEDFKKVISLKKIILLPKAEMEYKRSLIKRLKNGGDRSSLD